MRRRDFFSASGCGCALMPQAAQNDPNRGAVGPLGAEAFARVGSKTRITAVKAFGVTLPVKEQLDRP